MRFSQIILLGVISFLSALLWVEASATTISPLTKRITLASPGDLSFPPTHLDAIDKITLKPPDYRRELKFAKADTNDKTRVGLSLKIQKNGVDHLDGIKITYMSGFETDSLSFIKDFPLLLKGVGDMLRQDLAGYVLVIASDTTITIPIEVEPRLVIDKINISISSLRLAKDQKLYSFSISNDNPEPVTLQASFSDPKLYKILDLWESGKSSQPDGGEKPYLLRPIPHGKDVIFFLGIQEKVKAELPLAFDPTLESADLVVKLKEGGEAKQIRLDLKGLMEEKSEGMKTIPYGVGVIVLSGLVVFWVIRRVRIEVRKKRPNWFYFKSAVEDSNTIKVSPELKFIKGRTEQKSLEITNETDQPVTLKFHVFKDNVSKDKRNIELKNVLDLKSKEVRRRLHRSLWVTLPPRQPVSISIGLKQATLQEIGIYSLALNDYYKLIKKILVKVVDPVDLNMISVDGSLDFSNHHISRELKIKNNNNSDVILEVIFDPLKLLECFSFQVQGGAWLSDKYQITVHKKQTTTLTITLPSDKLSALQPTGPCELILQGKDEADGYSKKFSITVKAPEATTDEKRESDFQKSLKAVEERLIKKLKDIELQIKVAGSSLFSVGDFKDLVSLTVKLTVKLRDASDPLSQYLRGQFSDTTQQQLSGYDKSSPPSDSLQHILVDELNRLLQGDSLYDEQRFKQITLTEKTRSLIEQNPQGKDLIRLNRLLLEEAYPDEIAKSHLAPETWRIELKTLLTQELKEINQHIPEITRICRVLGIDEKTEAPSSTILQVLNNQSQKLEIIEDIKVRINNLGDFKELATQIFQPVILRLATLEEAWRLLAKTCEWLLLQQSSKELQSVLQARAKELFIDILPESLKDLNRLAQTLQTLSQEAEQIKPYVSDLHGSNRLRDALDLIAKVPAYLERQPYLGPLLPGSVEPDSVDRDMLARYQDILKRINPEDLAPRDWTETFQQIANAFGQSEAFKEDWRQLRAHLLYQTFSPFLCTFASLETQWNQSDPDIISRLQNFRNRIVVLLQDYLEVEPLSIVLGQGWNDQEHQVRGDKIPGTGYPPETIVEVLRWGYRDGNTHRVLQSAWVRIAM